MDNYLEDEVMRHRKKSKKKPPKKANHKHEYEPVILEYENRHGKLSTEKGFEPAIDYSLGKRCKICGDWKLTHFWDSIPLDNGCHLMVSGKDIITKNPDLPIVYVERLW